MWRINTLAPCVVPYLLLDRELLIASVTYTLDDRGGRITKMVLGPVEGYTPDPGQVKVRKNKNKGGAAHIWNGAADRYFDNSGHLITPPQATPPA